MPKEPVKNNSDWHILGSLFPSCPKCVYEGLRIFPRVLAKVWPLKENHRKSLPGDICELSQMLTSQRGRLDRPYWSKPAYISAYLYYFLPWNLLRLSRLLSALPLSAPAATPAPLLIDIGSGPFTLPIALWLARPHLQSLPIHVLATDIARQPLDLGQKLFKQLARELDKPVWHLQSATVPFWSLSRQVMADAPLKLWLLASANVFNELAQKKISDRDEDWMQTEFEELLQSWRPLFAAGQDASLLFIEPGTRLGGEICMELRKAGLNMGLYPQSPCCHDQNCPLLKEGSSKSSYHKSWCHFTFASQDVPEWLMQLTREAGLEKKSLSLSFLLLNQKPLRTNACRVISQAFAVPDYGIARYGCFKNGLALLPDSQKCPSGSLVAASATPKKDIKSGATILGPAISKN